MSDLYKIGWFSSGGSKTSRDIFSAVMDAIKRGEIQAEITFVFCSRDLGESAETDLFIKLVEAQGIPIVTFSYRKFKDRQVVPARDETGNLADWRLDYDREIMDRLQSYSPALCVLAGYMLVTGPDLCRKYDMINLHPAAPGGPVGTWRQVIWQLIGENADESGVFMNLVTPEFDRGPVVTYCKYPIRGEAFDRYWGEIKGLSVEKIKRKEGTGNSLFKLIRRHGLLREIPLIVSTLKIFSRGSLSVNINKMVIDVEDYPISGYDLTEEIEERIRSTG